jgi:hypothetical protein
MNDTRRSTCAISYRIHSAWLLLVTSCHVQSVASLAWHDSTVPARDFHVSRFVAALTRRSPFSSITGLSFTSGQWRLCGRCLIKVNLNGVIPIVSEMHVIDQGNPINVKHSGICGLAQVVLSAVFATRCLLVPTSKSKSALDPHR